MTGIESAVLKIATSLSSVALKALVAGRRSRIERTMSLAEIATNRGIGLKPARRLERQLQQLSESISERLEPVVEIESGKIRENEKNAALSAVYEVFAEANLSDEAIFGSDVNEAAIMRELRSLADSKRDSALLDPQGKQFFDLVLGESVSHLAELIVTLPSFQGRALQTLLERESEIIDLLKIVLERMPRRERSSNLTEHDEFTLEYTREVVRKFDQVELFGVTTAGPSRKYSLSVSYIGLSVDAATATNRTESTLAGKGTYELGVELAVSKTRLLYIRGEAGSGKTTLLRWLALSCAERSHAGPLKDWNSTVPFFVRLRRFAQKELPAPQDFLLGVSKITRDRMPDGWVDQVLEDRPTVLLVDGVDEFPEARRHELNEWVTDLSQQYPRARVIVTSRPAATPWHWLRQAGFSSADLTPMSNSHITAFIKNWHDAMMIGSLDQLTEDVVDEYRRSIVSALEQSRPLRLLASNPLLCALLCALHWDRRKKLPKGRIGIYKTALDMLLRQRDHERGIPAILGLDLSYEDSHAILQGLAYWYTITELTDAPRVRVESKIKGMLRSLPNIKSSASDVLDHLVLRSGLLREVTPGVIDFIHKTFQEYLAALRFLEEDSIEALLSNATRDSYQEVVVMTAGCARYGEAALLINALLDAAEKPRIHAEKRARLRFLAVSCLEVTTRRPKELDERVQLALRMLVPPSNMSQSRVLASLGESVMDVLPQDMSSISEAEAASTVRCAALVGGRQAVALLRNAASDVRPLVQAEVLAAWSYFEPLEFVTDVLNTRTGEWKLRINDPNVLHAAPQVDNCSGTSCRLEGSVSRSALRHIDRLTMLRSLELSRNWHLEVLDLMPHTDSLRELILRDCPNLEHVDGLDETGGITRVSIDGCPIRLTLGALRRLRKLRALRLLDATAVNWYGILENLPRLSRLDIGSAIGCQSISHLGASDVLASLSVREGSEVTSLHGIDFLPGLRQLSIERCIYVEDFSRIAAARHSLESLRLVGLPNGESLRFLSRMYQLKRLTIADSVIESAKPLADLHSLAKLEIDNCQFDDDTNLERLMKRADVRSSSTDLYRDPERLEESFLMAENQLYSNERAEVDRIIAELELAGEWSPD